MTVARCGALGALLLLLQSSLAQGASIDWSGSAECRREREVAEQVESMTGRPLPEVDLADFALALEVADETRLSLVLTTTRRSDGQQSSRRFEGRTCADVTDAAAVAIALTIGNRSEPDAAPTPQADPPRSRGNLANSSRPAALSPRPQSPLALRAGASAALDSSATPRLVPGAALRFAVATAKARAELEGTLYATGKTRDAKGEGGSFQLMYLAALACGQKSLGRPSLLLCGGYELGQLTGEGEGVAATRTRATLWHGPRAELGLAWPVSEDWSVSARLGGVLPLTRHSFVLDAPEAVHRPGQLSLRASFGVELKL